MLGGLWEFPGGKRTPRESWEACLRRELREELGIGITALRRLGRLRHAYVHGRIRFNVFSCRVASGSPRPFGASRLRWVAPGQLSRYRFPPANRPLLRLLRGDCLDGGGVL